MQSSQYVRPIRYADYVIVGGGIAGLYAACKILNAANQGSAPIRVVIIEGSSEIGGRARTAVFGGQRVPMGAGIGRGRDVLLKKLIEDMGLGPVKPAPRGVHLEPALAPHRSQWQVLWRKIQRHANDYAGQEFGKAIRQILGEEQAALWTQLSGYTDFERAEIMDAVRWYGMQDNAPGGGDLVFGVNWWELINRLGDAVGRDNIMLRCVAQRVMGARVECIEYPSRQPITWQARKNILVGVNLRQMLNLFPYHSPLHALGGQPFIRVYAELEEPLRIQGYTVVRNELQKIIPMSNDGRIVMIAYADNEAAKACWAAAVRNDKPWFERRLVEALHGGAKAQGHPVRIIRMWHKYWHVGTHYFKPTVRTSTSTSGSSSSSSSSSSNNISDSVGLADIRMVNQRVRLIGEAVSHKQGWVEGALESVNDTLHQLDKDLMNSSKRGRHGSQGSRSLTIFPV